MLRDVGRRIGALWALLIGMANREFIWWLLVAGGAVLRLRQFAVRLSFGNDEAALARNIIERSFSGLTQPLDYRQAAPLLFLFIQKTIVAALGNQDFVLELFPLVSALLAIYLFYRIARRELGPAGLVALLAFAISLWLIYYSANPKQYTTDVLVALLLVYLAGRCIEDAPRRTDLAWLALAGALGIWLSHPAAFVLPGIGLMLAVDRLRRKDWKGLAWTTGLGAIWAASFAGFYAVSLARTAANPYLLGYWLGAFMPLPPWSNPRWFVDAYRSLMLMSLGRTDAPALIGWLLLLLIGSASLLARKPRLAAILLLPFVTALAASALGKYPFQQRLILFLVPLVYLLGAEGLRLVYAWGARWNRPVALAVCAVVCVILLRPMAVSEKRNFFDPPRPYDMRPLVEYLRSNSRPGDSVFVSGGGETFAYYARSYDLQLASVKVSNTHRIVRYYQYMDRMATYAGKERVWIVFAYFEDGSHQYERYAKYLNRVGEIQRTFRTGYLRAFLCKFDP